MNLKEATRILTNIQSFDVYSNIRPHSAGKFLATFHQYYDNGEYDGYYEKDVVLSVHDILYIKEN